MPDLIVKVLTSISAFVMFVLGYKNAKRSDEIESLEAANEAFKKREKIQAKYAKKRFATPNDWNKLNSVRKKAFKS